MDKETLKKDPSLILSAVHAYAVNDLPIEEDIKELVINNREFIRSDDPEKVYNRLKDIMETPSAAKYIREFKEVFFEFIPGLEKTYGFQQNNPWHIYDVFEHTMHVIENTDTNPVLRVAALFHDLGKPVVYKEEIKTREDGTTYPVGHFFGHAKVSKIYFEEFAKAFKVPQEEFDLICKLIIYHDYNLSTKPQKIQEYIDDLGVENIPLLFALKRADNLAQNPEMAKPILEGLEKTEKSFNEYIAKMPKPEPKPEPVKKN